ncbi:MAG: helix-turn-helix transcriptional regulator [Bacteroides sp.]|nr:helix-turn-helix transcriptional regulator [Bacteroides sp.]MBD5331300.1 helix-turn-helix transcriptional regulator [Bacteroides sp.]MBD5376163.1 helix-turn-helix transcriptional regulator [Bacteroides sp.]
MSRIDLTRLRKRVGMSQRELASLLQVRPSFLSAIENGRSRLPEEKLEKIKCIFEVDNLDDYLVDESADIVVPPHTHASDASDTITLLLNHFHDLAHQREKGLSHQDNESAERIDFLTRRNDRLSERVDNLRDEVDNLRKENLRLKELLMKNGVEY